jgi:hypothetical protein
MSMYSVPMCELCARVGACTVFPCVYVQCSHVHVHCSHVCMYSVPMCELCAREWVLMRTRLAVCVCVCARARVCVYNTGGNEPVDASSVDRWEAASACAVPRKTRVCTYAHFFFCIFLNFLADGRQLQRAKSLCVPILKKNVFMLTFFADGRLLQPLLSIARARCVPILYFFCIYILNFFRLLQRASHTQLTGVQNFFFSASDP